MLKDSQITTDKRAGPQADKEQRFNPVALSYADMVAMKKDYTPRKHVLGKWLKEAESCLVYAGTGVGKSLFAYSIALAVASGGKLGNWKVGKQLKTLYVDGEMAVDDLLERNEDLAKAVGVGDSKVELKVLSRTYRGGGGNGHSQQGALPLIDSDGNVKWWLEYIKDNGFKLVVLDNISTLVRVHDLNNSSALDMFTDFLVNLKALGVTVIVVHHTNKKGDKEEASYNGSAKLTVTFEETLRLQNKNGRRKSYAEFIVHWEKLRGKDGVGFGKTWMKLVKGKDGYPQWHVDEPSPELKKVIDMLYSYEYTSQVELARAYGTSPANVSKMLTRAYDREWLIRADVCAVFEEAKAGKEEEQKGQEAIDDDTAPF